MARASTPDVQPNVSHIEKYRQKIEHLDHDRNVGTKD